MENDDLKYKVTPFAHDNNMFYMDDRQLARPGFDSWVGRCLYSQFIITLIVVTIFRLYIYNILPTGLEPAFQLAASSTGLNR